jgi:hypothetical protein
MALSTPGSWLKRWRTVIRHSYIINFNGLNITTKADLEHAVEQARQCHMIKAKIVIATDKTYGVHPHDGILQLHFDQLNVIAKHLEAIKNDFIMKSLNINAAVHSLHGSTAVTIDSIPQPSTLNEATAQSFTKKQLQQ